MTRKSITRLPDLLTFNQRMKLIREDGSYAAEDVGAEMKLTESYVLKWEKDPAYTAASSYKCRIRRNKWKRAMLALLNTRLDAMYRHIAWLEEEN